MYVIFTFLCVFANQVTSQSDGIFPGKIFADYKVISEANDLLFKCNPFGYEGTSLLYLYLCKDGLGILKKKQKTPESDVFFIMKHVNLSHSGGYSCVYSSSDYSTSEVNRPGKNTIEILVLATFLPADIFVVGSSAVAQGDSVEFRCTVPDTMKTHDGCQYIHSYLIKNKTIVRMEGFSLERKEATFTIEGAAMRDSGNYSCVVLPSKCIQGPETTLYGKNTVTVQVEETVTYWRVGIMGLVIILLLLCLLLCCVDKQVSWDRCFTVVEERFNKSPEPRAHTSMEVYEAPDEDMDSEDSFGTTEEQNIRNGAGATYAFPDSEGDYMFPDDIYADVEDLYSKCNKRTTHPVFT